jgi:hypothetical protein
MNGTKHGRDRKSEQLGRRIEGAKGIRAAVPAMVFGAVKELVEQFPAATMQGIVNELTECGLTTRNGNPYTQTQVARVIEKMGLERIDGRTRQAKAA